MKNNEKTKNYLSFLKSLKWGAKDSDGINETSPLIKVPELIEKLKGGDTKSNENPHTFVNALGLKSINREQNEAQVISKLSYIWIAVTLILPFVDMLLDIIVTTLWFLSDNPTVNNLAILVVVILVLTLRHQGALYLYLQTVNYREGPSGLSMLDGFILFVPFATLFYVPEGLSSSTSDRFIEIKIWSSLVSWMEQDAQTFWKMVTIRSFQKYKLAVALNDIISKWEDATETLPMLLVQLIIYIFYESPSTFGWLKLFLSLLITTKAVVTEARILTSKK